MSGIVANARVVGALGMRSIRQTFRRPQLIAPIIVFPTLLLAIPAKGSSRTSAPLWHELSTTSRIAFSSLSSRARSSPRTGKLLFSPKGSSR